VIGLENGCGWISKSTVSAEPLASTHIHLSNRPVTLIAESQGYPLTGYGGIVNRARLTWPAAALAGFSYLHIMRRGRPESERRNLLIRLAGPRTVLGENSAQRVLVVSFTTICGPVKRSGSLVQPHL